MSFEQITTPEQPANLPDKVESALPRAESGVYAGTPPGGEIKTLLTDIRDEIKTAAAPAEFLTFSAKLVKLCTELNASGDGIVWSIPKMNELAVYEYNAKVTDLNADQQTRFLNDLESRLAEIKAENETGNSSFVDMKEFLMKRDVLKTDSETENRLRSQLIKINELLTYSIANQNTSLATFDNKATIPEQQEYLRLKVIALRKFRIKTIKKYYSECDWNADLQAGFERKTGGFDCGLDSATDEQIKYLYNEMLKGRMI
jgi:hypothetical protein